MKKIICDICGSDKYVKEGFLFSIWVDMRSGIRNHVVQEKIGLDKGNVDLCYDCQKKIADMLYKGCEK